MDVGAESKSFGKSIIGLFEDEHFPFGDGVRQPFDGGWIVQRLTADDDGILWLSEIDVCVRRQRL